MTAKQQRSKSNSHSSTKCPQDTKNPPLAIPSPAVLIRTAVATSTREKDTRLEEHHLHHQHWQKALTPVPWSPVPSPPPIQDLSSQDCATHVAKPGNYNNHLQGMNNTNTSWERHSCCLQTSLSIQGTVQHRASTAHVVSVVSQEQAKLNKVLLLRLWLEIYCGGGKEVEKGGYLW